MDTIKTVFSAIWRGLDLPAKGLAAAVAWSPKATLLLICSGVLYLVVRMWG